MSRPEYQRIEVVKKVIENKWELLWWMESHSHRRGRAVLHKPTAHVREWEASRTFDHGYYCSSERREVEAEVVEAAIRDRIIVGKPEWGYTSQHEFILSKRGERELWDHVKQERELDEHQIP